MRVRFARIPFVGMVFFGFWFTGVGVFLLWEFVRDVRISGGSFAFLFAAAALLVLGLPLIRMLFWRIVLDDQEKTLTIPYWKISDGYDSSPRPGNAFSSLFSALSVFSRQKKIPLNAIRSVLIAPATESALVAYQEQYASDPRAYEKFKKYIADIALVKSTYQGQVVRQQTAFAAGDVLSGKRTSASVGTHIAAAAAMPLIMKHATPDDVLVIQLVDELVIRTLTVFRHDDARRLAEALRARGVNVLNQS